MMKRIRYKAVVMTGVITLVTTSGGAETNLPFTPVFYAAEGAGQIQYYAENGRVTWTFPAEMSRDVSRLPNGNILFSYNLKYNSQRHDNPSGVIEYDPKRQQKVLDFATTGQVWSCWRLADGRTLVGAASQGNVLIVDPQGKVTGGFNVKNSPGHACMRHVRGTPSGTVLVAEESARCVREYTLEGVLIREIPMPCCTFAMERLTNGNTIISGQRRMIEVDADGKTIWQLKAEDVPELGVRYLAGFSVLENGDLLVCNAGGKVPLFRVTRESKPRVVWQIGANRKIPLGHGLALCM